MEKIFVDSGAFIAWGSKTDNFHRIAAEKYRGLVAVRAPLITTNHIIDETCTWLLRRAPCGHHAAVKFGEFIHDIGVPIWPGQPLGIRSFNPAIHVIYSSPEIEQEAWDIFATYDTAGFSFTDCVSFAVMRELRIRKAFTFDTHFDLMGFERM